MQVSILKAPHGLSRWDLVSSYLALRRAVFVEQLNWDLTTHEGSEFEQYDTVGYASYVVAHEHSKVVAGCRLIRCDSTVQGRFTYMIKDAFDGRIDLPGQICAGPPPVDARHWELTRLVAQPNQRKATLAVMRASHEFLALQDAIGCLCLSSPIVERLARLSGYKTERLGPLCGNKDGKFVAFRIPIGDPTDPV